MSVKPSACSNCSVIICAIMQIVEDLGSLMVVVSRLGSAAGAPRAGSMEAAMPASAVLLRKRRRLSIVAIASLLSCRSRLQLAFKLVQKSPVGILGDDFLRARLDEARFPHAQSVEPDRVLRVVFAPFVVRQLTKCLEGIVIPRGDTTIHELSRGAIRFSGAEVSCLQNRAQHPLCRDGVSPHVIPIASQETAEILRPRTVDRRIDDNVADMPGAQFLWLGRKAEKRVDFARNEALDRLNRRIGNPVDILEGIKSDLGGQQG